MKRSGISDIYNNAFEISSDPVIFHGCQIIIILETSSWIRLPTRNAEEKATKMDGDIGNWQICARNSTDLPSPSVHRERREKERSEKERWISQLLCARVALVATTDNKRKAVTKVNWKIGQLSGDPCHIGHSQYQWLTIIRFKGLIYYEKRTTHLAMTVGFPAAYEWHPYKLALISVEEKSLCSLWLDQISCWIWDWVATDLHESIFHHIGDRSFGCLSGNVFWQGFQSFPRLASRFPCFFFSLSVEPKYDDHHHYQWYFRWFMASWSGQTTGKATPRMSTPDKSFVSPSPTNEENEVFSTFDKDSGRVD